MRAAYRFRVPGDVARILRTLHPDIKRSVRAALDAIADDPTCGKRLQGELNGLRSLRCGRFRIVYRIARRKIVEIVAIGPRERVYEETLRLVRMSARGPRQRGRN